MDKIDLLTIKKPKTFFMVGKNPLNNCYMVHSPYLQLPHCWSFKRKKDAEKQCKMLNIQAKTEYEQFIADQNKGGKIMKTSTKNPSKITRAENVNGKPNQFKIYTPEGGILPVLQFSNCFSGP